MWDPVLLIAQIISVQAIHYLTLSVSLPPLVYTCTDRRALDFTYGGAATVGMMMDWREMAGRRFTTSTTPATSGWNWLGGVSSILHKSKSKTSNQSGDPFPFLGHGDLDAHVIPTHSRRNSFSSPIEYNASDVFLPRDTPASPIGGWRDSLVQSLRDAAKAGASTKSTAATSKYRLDTEDGRRAQAMEAMIYDRRRAWVIAAGWLIASTVDVFVLYVLVRRPTMILDFSLTLVLNHIILTTYGSGGFFPTSIFFWIVMAGGAMICIVFAEQLCVRREMREGLKAVTSRRRAQTDDEDDEEDMHDEDDDSDFEGVMERGLPRQSAQPQHESIQLMERRKN